MGRRTPQPPLDLEHDGGLARHRIVESTWSDGIPAIAPHYSADPVHQRVVANNPTPNLLGFARRIESAELELLPDAGTLEEQI
ncbi:hypothetical protein, partial [Mycolicibacterium hippocampi]|uniref:hypothetical protein n=1 Tax=Mycolicibacterium hippocampi TaxID=659824 RepID=UPI0035146D93